MKAKTITILLVSLLAVGGFFYYNSGESNEGSLTISKAASDQSVTVFKSASCGCCVGYSGELERNDYDVDIKIADMPDIHRKYSIPKDMESCHLALVGDYFVEGHVPLEAVEKLLLEKPDIDGIALPNMPAGTPGMPGIKSGPWTIYSIKDGEAVSVFMVI